MWFDITLGVLGVTTLVGILFFGYLNIKTLLETYIEIDRAQNEAKTAA